MNLPLIIQQTSSFWNLPKKTLFHNLINLVISQKISFAEGRKIRQNLYKKINNYEITKEIIKNLTDIDFKKCGMDNNKIEVVKKIIEEENLTITSISKIKGIGPWTIKSLKILNDESGIFLSEDYWIRKRLKELYNKEKIPSIKEAELLVKDVDCDKSHISKFLWRIKPQGIEKIKNNINLEKNDFL